MREKKIHIMLLSVAAYKLNYVEFFIILFFCIFRRIFDFNRTFFYFIINLRLFYILSQLHTVLTLNKHICTHVNTFFFFQIIMWLIARKMCSINYMFYFHALALHLKCTLSSLKCKLTQQEWTKKKKDNDIANKMLNYNALIPI